MRWLLSLIFAVLFSPIAFASLTVENPERAHGYFIGDILLQRLKLDSAGENILVGSIDAEQRINDFLYRLPIKVVSIENIKWLELRYQIINAPVQTQSIALPAMVFASESGKEFNLQPWSFTVASLISSADGDNTKPLPSIQAVEVVDRPNSQLLKISVAGLIATLALWLLWWVTRHLNDAETLPFAKAMQSIKQVSRGDRNTDARSWVALHRAINAVGGKTISTSSLNELYLKAPWLKEFEVEIADFYSASAARFYQQVESEPFAVAKLCKKLHRAEKRQAKRSVHESRSTNMLSHNTIDTRVEHGT